MNINKHDAETDMEMNMTPMIDVVFLLIIFFMVITDMTQADLEDLTLPTAVNARDDKPDPEDFRPVLNIRIDGSIWYKRKSYYDYEEAPEDYAEVKALLVDFAVKMKLKNKDPKSDLPDSALLIRADENTPFKFVQKIMEICGDEQIKIWKIQLASSVAEKDKEASE